MTWVDEVRAARDGGATFFDLLTAVDHGDSFEVVVRLWDPQRRVATVLRDAVAAGNEREGEG